MANIRKAASTKYKKKEAYAPKNNREEQLIKALISLKTEKEMAALLRDMLTPAEIEEFANRITIVRLLNEGLPYLEIAKMVGTSTTTVTRVAHWLYNGCGGYQSILKISKNSIICVRMIKLSPGQKDVLDKTIAWCKKDKSQSDIFITIGGYAGTGKTTLIAILRKRIVRINKDMKVGFVSYTGKAARVLRNKLKEAKVILHDDTVGTIHSLIYSPVVNEKEEIIGWKQKEKIDRDLIIIDEASMVDETIWLHLLSYKVPIIVVGDHGQLPPISGSFHLIANPELELVEIHRQAQNNPIISLSIQARQNGYIRPGIYGNTVRKFGKNDSDAEELVSELLSNYSPDTLILCGIIKQEKN